MRVSGGAVSIVRYQNDHRLGILQVYRIVGKLCEAQILRSSDLSAQQ